MKNKRIVALAGLVIIALSSAFWFLPEYISMPIREKNLITQDFGSVTTAYPLFGSRFQVVAFIDTKKIDAGSLARRLARLKSRAIVVDAEAVQANMFSDSGKCLGSARIKEFFTKLQESFPLPQGQKQVVGGIGKGALLPFLRATLVPDGVINVSVDFSAALPPHSSLCAPYKTEANGGKPVIAATPGLQGQWRSVWTDQPSNTTAILVRGLPGTVASILPYDTPLDAALIDQVSQASGAVEASTPFPSIVEVPADKPKDTVTIFYSGDGGWRDLDRAIAQKMAKKGYPVVGIDTLRDFWNRKSPEQTAEELSSILKFYRKKWHARSFVLAGYSFGADLLPIVLNKLPQQERDSVRLVVLLAFSEDAEFEIHVSGWLGKGGGEYKTIPALEQLPQERVFCIYGLEEKAESGCTSLLGGKAEVLELPGGHHFDKDYEKLTSLILDKYRKAGLF